MPRSAQRVDTAIDTYVRSRPAAEQKLVRLTAALGSMAPGNDEAPDRDRCQLALDLSHITAGLDWEQAWYWSRHFDDVETVCEWVNWTAYGYLFPAVAASAMRNGLGPKEARSVLEERGLEIGVAQDWIETGVGFPWRNWSTEAQALARALSGGGDT